MVQKRYFFHIPKLYHFARHYLEQLNQFRIIKGYVNHKRILGKKTYEFVKEYYREDNQKLSEFIGKDKLHSYNYPH